MDIPNGARVAGIVCEYNPFHSGHTWMIEKLRQSGIEAVVCVMSGPFVQRGQAACLPSYLRAGAAVQNGADLVFRLPAPWALASAEGFAHAGVGLLAALGCVEVLAFGAETAALAQLEETARMLRGGAFRAALQAGLKEGQSFAAARAAAAEAVLPGSAELLRSPNNILAVEYCKALQKGFAELEGLERGEKLPLPRPLALPRRGAAHDGEPEADTASASWLRQKVSVEGTAALRGFVPPACQTLYELAEAQGEWLDDARYELMLLARLRTLPSQGIAACPGAGEGLENRLAAAAKRAVRLEELYTLAKTKRYAHARIRRLAVSAALGIPAGLPALPPFLHLLAASPRGLALLSRAKSLARLPLSASLATLAKTGGQAKRVAQLEAGAEDLHALCLQKPKAGGGAYTRPLQLFEEPL